MPAGLSLPGALTWGIVQNSNCFLVKRSKGERGNEVRFSTEVGNLMNQSTYKFSGIANANAIDINSVDGELVMQKKVKGKTAKAGVQFVKIPIKRNFRRIVSTIKSQAIDNAYRGDLEHAALARWSVVHRSKTIAAGTRKGYAIKRGRR